MKWFRFVVCLSFIFFSILLQAQVQEVDIYEGMTWYLRKSVALDLARSQGKQVFFVWGKTDCAFTNGVKKSLAQEPLKSIINENYVLWFANYEKYKRDSPEVSDYLSELPSSITFPVICVINMYDEKIPHGLKIGPQNSDDLQEMLIHHVSNDYIIEKDIPVSVYMSSGKLVIKNEIADEVVRIFGIDGSLKQQFHKTECHAIYNVSFYPKGIFIVTGASGWVRKIIVK